MSSSQPKWKTIISTDFYLVQIDETGAYAPEIEVAEGDGNRFEVYRQSLAKLYPAENGGAVNEHGNEEWFSSAEDLAEISTTAGRGPGELLAALCSDDVMERAHAYMDVAGHHGWANFDQYPLRLSETELNERWA